MLKIIDPRLAIVCIFGYLASSLLALEVQVGLKSLKVRGVWMYIISAAGLFVKRHYLG